jgi:hypothetical protein
MLDFTLVMPGGTIGRRDATPAPALAVASDAGRPPPRLAK